jgi:hypothetical protein
MYGIQRDAFSKLDEVERLDRLKKGFLARASSRYPGVSIRKNEFPDGNYLAA